MNAGSRAVLTAASMLIWIGSASSEAAESVKPVVERVEGRLHVYQVDNFAEGRFPLQYELEQLETGERIPLRVAPGQAATWKTGMFIRADVSRRQGVLELDRVVDLQPRADGVAQESWADGFQAQITGQRRALVMVVDFQDSSVSCSDNQIESTVWTGSQSVDGLYRETSYGDLSFPADTDGDGQADVMRVTIPNSIAESCDSSGWASAANSAAAGAGANLGDYQHHVYVLPGNVDCGWAGLGSLGCAGSCRAWVKTCGLPDVYAHELGHNLGMHHASTDEDNDGTQDCEYCDRSDFMGIGGVGWRQVNAPHKEQMGWLPPTQIVSIDGAADQTAVISALETDPAQALFPQALTFSLPGGQKYYLSYRERVGYDSNLNSTYHSRVNIHRFAGSGRTLFVGAVGDGQTFSDPNTGFTVTQLSQGSSQATVLIGSGCEAETPTWVWADSQAQGAPGESVRFQGTLTNEDPEGCAASSFTLSASLPAGWSGDPAPQSVSLAAGESVSVDWDVTPPLSAEDGNYTADLTVSGPAEAHDLSTEVQYTVAGSAPQEVEDLSGTAFRRGFVALRWSAVTATDAAIAGYRIYRDGSMIGSTAATEFLDARPCGAATCSYVVRSVDTAGRVSTPGDAVSIAPAASSRKGADQGMR